MFTPRFVGENMAGLALMIVPSIYPPPCQLKGLMDAFAVQPSRVVSKFQVFAGTNVPGAAKACLSPDEMGWEAREKPGSCFCKPLTEGSDGVGVAVGIIVGTIARVGVDVAAPVLVAVRGAVFPGETMDAACCVTETRRFSAS